MTLERETLAVSQSAGVLVDHLFRNSAGQMVSHLTRLLGPEHLDLAEEVVQDALLKALQIWAHSGVPDNPAGWLYTVARNTALDAVRRRTSFSDKTPALAAEIFRTARPFGQTSDEDLQLEEQLRDDELRMVLMCCDPALSRDASVALSLKTVGGFSTAEIARAFLAEESTIAQRLVRAKRQIREQQIRFEVPVGGSLAARLNSALEVLYLMFNEGYSAQSGENLVREQLCVEALRLGRLLAASSLSTPSTHALVALMAFQAARLPARVDAAGDLVLIYEQDRNLWDRRLIGLGFHHFAQSAEGETISAYHVQAAIAAIHAQTDAGCEPDWSRILELYDELMELGPSPVVALNRAVAVSKVHGSESALEALRRLESDPTLRNYYLLPAIQGRLLMDSGNREAAAAYFEKAIALPCSEPERRFLRRKFEEAKATE